MLKHRSSGALYFFVHLSYKADVISSDSPCSRKAVWIQVFRTQISCAVHHCFKRRQGLWSVQLLIFWGCLNTHNMDQKNILDQRTLDHLLWHRRDGRWDFQAHSSLQWKSRAFGLNFCPPLYCSMYLLQSSHLQPVHPADLLQNHQDQSSSLLPPKTFPGSYPCSWHVPPTAGIRDLSPGRCL